MIFILAGSLLISLVFIILILSVSKKTNRERESASPFECGFDPVNIFRAPFSLRFFFIMLMFLIFDIEIVIILPMPYSFLKLSSYYWGISSVIFMLILIWGLMMEWKMGTISWA